MKYFDIETGLDIQVTKEEEISLANQCSFANRYPIKKDVLGRMSDLSIEGAALYRFDIDPGAIQNELEHAGHEHASIELPEGFSTELAIIQSAVRAGLITRAPFTGSDPGRICDDTRILKDSFFDWINQQESVAKNAPQAAPAANISPIPPAGAQVRQEDEILRIIKELKINPLKLPEIKPGKKGIKSNVSTALKWEGTIFSKAWERLAAKGLIKYLK